MDELIQFLSRVKRGDIALPSDEAATKQGLVLPVLMRLGWNVFDPTEVVPEYSAESRSVDYALRYGKEAVFIEVKKPTEDLDKHEQQLLQYAFLEAIDLAVLTNGRTWSFYLPRRKVSLPKRKFYTVDLAQQEVEDAARVLRDLLGKVNVVSGKALEAAEALCKGREKEQAVKEALPKAWNHLVSEPDGFLVELVNDAVERLSGYRAATAAISNFLKGQVVSPGAEPVSPPRPRSSSEGARTYTGHRPKALSFHGKRIEVRNWRDVLVQLSGLLYSLHKDDFSRCLTLRGKSRSHRPLVTKGPPEHGKPSYRPVPGSPYFVLVHGAAQTGTMARCHRLLGLFGYESSDLKIETL